MSNKIWPSYDKQPGSRGRPRRVSSYKRDSFRSADGESWDEFKVRLQSVPGLWEKFLWKQAEARSHGRSPIDVLDALSRDQDFCKSDDGPRRDAVEVVLPSVKAPINVASAEADDPWAKLREIGIQRQSNFLQESRWIYQHFYIPVEQINPESVPSSGAVDHLLSCRRNSVVAEQFMTQVWPRTMPRPEAIENLLRQQDNGMSTMELLDSFSRAMDEVDEETEAIMASGVVEPNLGLLPVQEVPVT